MQLDKLSAHYVPDISIYNGTSLPTSTPSLTSLQSVCKSAIYKLGHIFLKKQFLKQWLDSQANPQQLI